MEAENLIDLFSELKRMRFWGSVKVNFQEGEPVHLETSQTIKNFERPTRVYVHETHETSILE